MCISLTVYCGYGILVGMIANVITVKLKDLADEKEISLFAIAKQTGISYNTLFNIKEGKVKSMSFDVLEKLCKNLACTPNDLLEIKEDVSK